MALKDFKINPPAGGQKYSKKELKQIETDAQAEFENKQRMDGMANEANIQVQAWADNTIYDGQIPFGISDNVRATLRHFSDMTLKMPFEAYKTICSTTDGKYSINHMNNVMTILMTASAEMLGMDMDSYMLYKEDLNTVAAELSTMLDTNMARIKSEVEATFNVPVVTAGEA